jgi:hypothetical protein
MLADCDRCELRDIACPDCVISVLPEGRERLGPAEWRALRALADAGMVPPLRFSDVPAPRASVGEPVETALALH